MLKVEKLIRDTYADQMQDRIELTLDYVDLVHKFLSNSNHVYRQRQPNQQQ